MNKLLFDSAVNNDISNLDRALAEGYSVNSTTFYRGLNLIMINTIFNREEDGIEYIKYLINHGIDINYKTKSKHQNALNIATLSCNFDVCKLLIDKGIDINSIDIDKKNSLLLASNNWYTEFINTYISLYLECDLNRNELCDLRRHLLQYWNNKKLRKDIINNHYEIIKLLLDSGIDKSIEDSHNNNAMDLLLINDNIKELRFVDLLNSYGINPSIKFGKNGQDLCSVGMIPALKAQRTYNKKLKQLKKYK